LGDTGLPRALVTAIIRRELATTRARLVESPDREIGDPLPAIRAAVDQLRLSRIRGVINGTGVVVHTNLGRSPLAPSAVDALSDVARGYSNLEFDLATGERGSRGQYVEQALATLCGAEAATVANNCAAALVLTLRHLVTPSRPHVVISRGELVQIGGGFRVPEILETSGAVLREVGTTNQTTVSDYAKAIDDRTAMVLQVHRSNFYMDGFVASPTTAELAQVTRDRGVPLVHDLGSGHVAGLEGVPYIEDEPTPRDALGAGADLVVFSGDKLLGGPQAGIIAGRAGLVAGIKKQPLFRAMRCDKLVLTALQATTDLYLEGELDDLPTLAMAAIGEEALRARAERLVAGLAGTPLRASVVESEARMGGGSLPRTVIPSVAVELVPNRGGVGDLAAALRRGTPPVVAHVASGALRIDLRTVSPRQDDALLVAIRAAVGNSEA
jgi:L-seryl-tRNA(Ser) seleniumtransferase